MMVKDCVCVCQTKSITHTVYKPNWQRIGICCMHLGFGVLWQTTVHVCDVYSYCNSYILLVYRPANKNGMVLCIIVVTACAPDGFVSVYGTVNARSLARRNLSCIKILSDVGAAAAAALLLLFSLFSHTIRGFLCHFVYFVLTAVLFVCDKMVCVCV